MADQPAPARRGRPPVVDRRPGHRVADAAEVIDQLRSPGGCAWVAAQDHASLTPFVLEEAREVAEALEVLAAAPDNPARRAALTDELGDLLFQVLFHARVASEHASAPFDLDDVAAALIDKLVRRNPHVFGDERAETLSEIEAQWQAVKAAERAGEPLPPTSWRPSPGPLPAARRNAHGQPIGEQVPGWSGAPWPTLPVTTGRWCTLEPLAPEHAAELAPEVAAPEHEALWTYLQGERPADVGAYVAGRRARDTVEVLIRDGDGVACGVMSLMRIDQAGGVVEVGDVLLGPRLQRRTAATEAMSLLARHVFDLGYRRYEWKCDALNAPSRRAAERLGFTYEGTFAHHVVTKGRARDTAWFSMLAEDWPRIRAAHDAWLDPANHDDEGRQRTRLTVR